MCHGTLGGRGAAHDFAVTPAHCEPCHEDAAASLERGQVLSAELTARASALASALGVELGRGHASFAPLGDARDDARRAVAIVLGDRSAGVHGAAAARALLDRATRTVRRR